MRDPMTHLNEAIASVVEAFAYLSVAALVVMLLVAGALELRSRIRRPERRVNAGARGTSRDRDNRRRTDRVASAAS
jgi:hypothetical protein